MASASSRMERRHAAAITGLNTFKLQMPVGRGDGNRGVVAHHLGGDLGDRASAWVGLTLPGMMDEPGSFAGR